MMIPCLSTKSINNLFGTADERYNYSREFFRNTHFPQTLNRYYRNQLVETINESGFLKELEEEKGFGNRVYLIFGSTGSGKSELLCWLKDQWRIEKTRPIIRISRNELNPQILVKKCIKTIGIELGDLIIDENKWDLLLTKPVTIINQIVWTTMSELFDSDDLIVPATMLLRPVIEKNILAFTKQVEKGKISKPLEIITKEEYDALLDSTTLKLDVNYYKFRNSLLKKLDQFLFQGTDIKEIFKRLSNVLTEQKIRPVLLIDDLVQSINLYAADLLDYFITLEEGSWDVVIGLTPGVEQAHDFDSELKSRIKNLDTIDDRVKKLWLSDESGSNFFTLDKSQAQTYITKYLVGLKGLNGFSCSKSCPNADYCGELLGNNSEEGLNLLPFNKPLINRIYDGIPKGKGTLRYLILNSREILQFLIKGDAKKAAKLSHFLNRDVFVDHHDKLIKILGEMYAMHNEDKHTVFSSLLKHFKSDSEDVVVDLRKLQYDSEVPIEKHFVLNRNVVAEHIRDWIEGIKVKEQLLEPVRSGVATIVHEIVKGIYITKEHTSRSVKSTATIQRAEVVNRYKYPISFSHKDNTQIFIDKDINLIQVANFQQLKMQDRSEMFQKIANDKNIADWIYQTEKLKEEWKIDLEESIGYDMATFAYYFKKFINDINMLGQSEWTSSIKSPIKEEWIELAENLFLDWFSLRDNIIDFNKLDKLSHSEDFIKWFLNFNPTKELSKYQIMNKSLNLFLVDIRSEIEQYIDSLQQLVIQKANEIRLLQKHIENISIPQHVNLIDTFVNKVSFSLEDIININEIVSWFSNEDNKEFVTRVQQEITYLENMEKFLPLVIPKSDLQEQFLDIPMMEEYFMKNLNVRSQVRKHLLRLLETGQTQLPRKQWKGILRDMEEFSPDFFELVNVSINMRKS
ncbi:hypothetical protein [Bacillus sp. JJ1562]|uniref:hypothetical protein n=1 Tax=Bacillus sp. JJ1562 TaxID=3122960 RepID=UPI003002BF6C